LEADESVPILPGEGNSKRIDKGGGEKKKKRRRQTLLFCLKKKLCNPIQKNRAQGRRLLEWVEGVLLPCCHGPKYKAHTALTTDRFRGSVLFVN